MARLSEILAHGWPGRTWSVVNVLPSDSLADQYDKLVWHEAGGKPALSDIQAQAAATDAALAAEERAARQQRTAFAERDAMLRAVEVLARAVQDLQATNASLLGVIRAQAVTEAPRPLTAVAVTTVQALVNKVNAARDVT